MQRRPTDRDLKGLDTLAYIMDRALPIPGTKIRVGLDALLGLLPLGGDALTGLVQIGIVIVALTRYQVPKPIAARMAANVLLDTCVGIVPFAGDAFDVFFKANTRNLALLRQVELEQMAGKSVSTRGSIFFLTGLVAILLVVLGLVVVGSITVLSWIWHQIRAPN